MEGSVKDALQRIGVSRIEAELMDFLRGQADVSTKEALAGTDLRQPEVSVGMRELVDRGWVETEPIPRQGKGRPMNRYRLVADPTKIGDHYLALGNQTAAALDRAIAHLDQIFIGPQ